MRSFTDFAYVGLAITPLFLFSATFFPIDRYPAALEVLVEVSPLYQGVAIERALVLGEPTWVLLLRAAYLAALGLGGVRLASRRLGRLLVP